MLLYNYLSYLGVQHPFSKRKNKWIVSSRSPDTFFSMIFTIACEIKSFILFINRRWIVTSSKDKTCRVWDSSKLCCSGIAEGHTDAVGAVVISQRNSTYISKVAFIVSGAGDKVIKRWPLPTDKLCGSHTILLEASHSVRAHDKDVNALAISPNDAMIASGSQDRSIRLWNSIDLSPVATLKGHKRGVWRLAFSPVDRCLASCSGDRTVKLWSVTDYVCLRTFEGHSCSVLCVQFVNRGMQLISGSADGIIKLWTIRTGECEWTEDAHDEKIWVIRSGPTDGQFISGGCDSQLKLWHDITVAEEEERVANEEKALLAEQQMSNDIRQKRYGKVKTKIMNLLSIALLLIFHRDFDGCKIFALREMNRFTIISCCVYMC